MKTSLGKFFLLVLGGVLFVACAGAPHRPEPKKFTSYHCEELYPKKNNSKGLDEQLDRVSELFNGHCFQETIILGDYLRRQGHDKFYQISTEVGELFTPEGTFTEYTLESYERAYLSLLIAMSYANLQKPEAVLVELRRSLEEDTSYIYNYGSDPVVALLMAAIWDRYDPLIARPFWKKVSEVPGQEKDLVKLARARIKEIDQSGTSKVNWRIYGIGQLPEVDWHSDFIMQKQGPYEIVAKTEFPPRCSTNETLLVPTSTWVEKIGMKYRSSYHPLLFAKSLLRLPVGLGYGVLGVASGVGIGGGGCILEAKVGGSNGAADMCGASLELGGYIIGQTGNLVAYTLRPDMRHWKKVPMAFYLTREETATEAQECLKRNYLVMEKSVYLLE